MTACPPGTEMYFAARGSCDVCFGKCHAVPVTAKRRHDVSCPNHFTGLSHEPTSVWPSPLGLYLRDPFHPPPIQVYLTIQSSSFPHCLDLKNISPQKIAINLHQDIYNHDEIWLYRTWLEMHQYHPLFGCGYAWESQFWTSRSTNGIGTSCSCSLQQVHEIQS